MAYHTWEYWVSRFWANTVFHECFHSQVKGEDASTQLSLVKTDNLNYWE
jgi:hypothetical protein